MATTKKTKPAPKRAPKPESRSLEQRLERALLGIAHGYAKHDVASGTLLAVVKRELGSEWHAKLEAIVGAKASVTEELAAVDAPPEPDEDEEDDE